MDREGEARQYERKSRDIELRLATSVAKLKTDREAQLLVGSVSNASRWTF
ncbi:MAG: hypothetical protein IPO05_18225 [Flavobacteriales bacterium]|nr:hypothetical protein [Flavobacteriales bacterium]